MSKIEKMGLSSSDLNDLDNEILDCLQEGRATPTLIKRLLEQKGTREEISRQYVNQRLKRLSEHEHIDNILETGVYELVDDPRDTVTNNSDKSI